MVCLCTGSQAGLFALQVAMCVNPAAGHHVSLRTKGRDDEQADEHCSEDDARGQPGLARPAREAGPEEQHHARDHAAGHRVQGLRHEQQRRGVAEQEPLQDRDTPATQPIRDTRGRGTLSGIDMDFTAYAFSF